MGKKDKDKEKQAAKKEAKAKKQEAKAGKSAKKAARKSGAIDSDEEDIEVIMKELALQDAKKIAITVEIVPQPSARVNFSLTALPSGELIIFGGEYFDGAINTCYNQLYRFEPPKHAVTPISISDSLMIGCTGHTVSSSSSSSTLAIPSNAALPTNQGTWKAIISPNTPGHRCSHQAVLHNNTSLYLYGGEFATANQFYHYNDTWKLDLPTNKWQRIESKKSPSARSGHRMLSWRNYILLFGGFYQTLTHDRWFNDLWVLDTRSGNGGLWNEIVYPSTVTTLPSPRSGTQFVLVPNKDVAIVYGGYSEIRPGQDKDSLFPPKQQNQQQKGGNANLLFKKTRSMVHTDMWLLRLTPILNGSLPVWERIRMTGIPPTPRVGFAMTAWKDRILLFGGVLDKEGAASVAEEANENAKQQKNNQQQQRSTVTLSLNPTQDIIRSTFYNDLYSFDIGRRRWYQLELRKKKSETERRRKPKTKTNKKGNTVTNDGDNDDDDDIDLEDTDEDEEEALAAVAAAKNQNHEDDMDDSAFYYYHNGKLVRIDDEPEDEENLSTIKGKEAAEGNDETKQTNGKIPNDEHSPKPQEPKSPATILSSDEPSISVTTPKEPEVALPCPSGRIRCGMWMDGHWLYVFGGLREEFQPGTKGLTNSTEREVTLDDMWRIDLRERNGWECMLTGHMHLLAWNAEEDSDDEEPSEDEDEDNDESDDDDDEEDDDENNEEDNGAEHDEEEKEDGDESNRKKKGTSNVASSTNRYARSQGRMTKEAARIRELRDRLGIEDINITPQPGEKLGTFFARTVDAWTERYIASGSITEGIRISGKDIRRAAFGLARIRYEEVWPLLQELHEIEEAQRELEAEAAAALEKAKAKAKGKRSNK